MKDWFTIGEFSKRTGFSNKALRLYEEKDLLVPHSRSENSYRYYSSAQLELAKKIQHFKSLGFSLEQIKVLLVETKESSLKELLEKRLQECRSTSLALAQQIATLETILASLTIGQELTDLERSQVMENLLEASIDKLKRRGLVDQHTHGRLSDEVALFSSEISQTVPEFRRIVEYARKQNILLGPGRGTSPASLVLFAEGYSPINPLQFGLLPELFSRTKYLHLEVEYSRHQELGQMCDELKSKTKIDVVAFRSPILDIFAEMKKKIGEVDFDKFSDFDPMILQAPKKIGVRGLFGIEWNSNYHAWQKMPDSLKTGKNWRALEGWFSNNTMNSPEDYINLQIIHERWSPQDLTAYSSAKGPEDLPELQNSKGYMIFREDWIKILMRLKGVDALQAREVLAQLSDMAEPAQKTIVDEISDEKIKTLLKKTAPGTFAKSHAVASWWYYKRTAILKSLWPKEYLATVDAWEQRHGLIWQEFGYPLEDAKYYLKANEI